MTRKAFISSRFTAVALAAAFTAFGAAASRAAPLAIRDTPLFITDNYAPLNMLVMGRDHKLYYEAYNDHSDLNEDTVLDVGYKPAIDYYGYFDPKKCYTYSSSNKRFDPSSVTADKKCSAKWSGNWLNWATTSRLDALRKVLYGGLRSTDATTGLTVLERSHIPQDAHGWVKEYISEAVNGYKISDYTPYSAPAANSSHLFGNTTLYGTTEPLLRVLENQQDSALQPLRAWNWASIERPVVGDAVVKGITSGGAENRVTVTVDGSHTFSVRAKVCDSSVGLEDNCRAYVNNTTTIYKPIGLLQDFGENDAMKFGLITGSYSKNTDGGVLRSAIGSIKNEIDLTNGTFKTDVSGIITTLNRLHATGFKSDYSYNCGWITTRAINAGDCQMWGNPIAEMMYESLRYFAGKTGPTSAYSIAFGAGEEANLVGGGLPVATWDSNTNPYRTGSNPSCSKPFETVISDINPSYDTDKLPGIPSQFGSFTGDLSGLNVSTLGQSIWNGEFGSGASKNVFIGEVAGVTPDSAPTAKTATSFGNIRGLAPEEPTKQGGYYSASVAYYGHNTDLNGATGSQKLTTFAVALASPLPRIEIPVGSKKVTLVPFAKSVAGAGIDRTSSFQPTDQIVDFYVDSLTDTSGKFRVNFEDVEQGADHDMDAIAIYEYKVVGGNVEVTLTSEYAAGGITQHMGYVISGTTKDGIYLEVVDQRGGDSAEDVDYRLDTPPGKGPGEAPNDGKALPQGKSVSKPMEPLQPIKTTRTFTPGTTAGAEILQDPLWYAAKWGGFKDLNKDGFPDKIEWDADNDSTPDNYFLVTNALTLKAQLSNAFEEIIARSGSASSAAVNSGSITESSRLYQALFSTADWSGSLIAYKIQTDGTLNGSPWAGDAARLLPAPNARKIFTTDSAGNKIGFTWDKLDTTRKGQLQPSDTKGQDRLDWLRGIRTKEIRNTGGYLRNRNPDTVLGDIVNAAPLYVGAPPFRYGALESKNYNDFRKDHLERKKMLYVGANDGMLHAFTADDGKEEWAFIPSAVFKNLHELTSPGYQHRFYVDGSPAMGDVFYGNDWHTVIVGGLNNGGQGIYALDVTTPSAASSEQGTADAKYRWEFTDTNDKDLGYTFSRPAIARVKNGKWVAIFGNGYNNTVSDGTSTTSTTGNAVLYIVDIENGSLLKKLDTGVGMSADPLATNRPNGLSTPAIVDVEGDFAADYVYAGDLFGNVWKFDITNNDTANWKVSYKDSSTNKPLPIFTAKDGATTPKRQPITSKPSVMPGKRGVGLQILFGTGKYLELTDRDVTQLSTQTFYSIVDNLAGTSTDIISGRSQLTPQTIVAETTVEGRPVRVTSATPPISNSRGWYMDLVSPGPTFKGEMVVSNSVIRNGRVLFSTLIPNTDPCGYGGTSFLMDMDARTGMRTDYAPFDVNGDGEIDDDDYISVTINGVTTKVPASGVGSTVGITGTAAVVVNGDGTLEHQYQTGTGDGSSSTGSDSSLSEDRKKPPPGAYGRQSWRQLR
jgi:type IV pilus assembly protein PilY1